MYTVLIVYYILYYILYYTLLLFCVNILITVLLHMYKEGPLQIIKLVIVVFVVILIEIN